MQTEGERAGLGRIIAGVKFPAFRWLLGSNCAVTIGFFSLGMAQGWLVLDLTDSPFWVGVTSGTTGVVSLVFSPFAGVAADRIDRRSILIAGQLAMVASLAALGVLVLLDLVALWHVVAVAGVYGVMRASSMPVRASLAFDIVGRGAIMNALASQSTATYMASILGPLAGGFVLARAGAGWLYLGIALVFSAAACLLVPMKPPPRAPSAESASFLANLREGVGFAVRHRPTRAVLIGVLVTETCGFAVLFMLPVVVRDTLHADARVLGYLMSLWGLGGITSSLFLASRGRVRSPAIVFAACATVLGLALVSFALSRNLALSLVFLFIAGGAGSSYDTMAVTLIQTQAPDSLRGRVSGLYSLLLSGVSLGSMGMGALAEFRGITFAVASGGALVAGNGLRMLGGALRVVAGRPPAGEPSRRRAVDE